MTELLKPQSIWDPHYDKYTVVDFETTVKAPAPWKFRADPRFKHNTIVAVGLKKPGLEPELVHVPSLFGKNQVRINVDTIAIGHNLKFDLQYIFKQPGVENMPCAIWDTGIAHNMMTGQKARMPSLNEVAEFYGLGQKESEVKDLWDMGVQTEDIEPSILMSYLKQDVLLTEKVYLAQMERLKDLPKLRDHILRVSTASKFLARCEYNGLPTNSTKVLVAAAKAKLAIDNAKVALYTFAEDRYKIPAGSREMWDPTTPSMLGKLIFDLPITIEDWEPAGRVLSSGKVSKRRRKIELTYTPPVDALHLKLQSLPIPKTASGAIQTSEDLLDTMERARPELIPHIKTYREQSKLNSTYMKPTVDWLNATGWPHIIYPSFHQTTTITGRTSSSGPNAQQMPPELEKCIEAPVVGQFIVKADFKQLQIAGVAMLSGDPQLIDDLNHGRDVHYETGKTVFKWTDESQMTKEDRRVVKNTNFGLLFGGGAVGIAKQTGVDKGLVQACIDAFFARYPKVKEWVQKNIALVESVSVPAEGEFINGVQVREAYLQTPAGRILRFTEHESPPWLRRKTGKPLSFSPNEIANYPVQAYCDGDLAQVFLAILEEIEDPVWKPINFVHDSVWLLTSDSEKTKLQLSQALDVLNTKMGLSVPLVLEYTVEDSNGNKVG